MIKSSVWRVRLKTAFDTEPGGEAVKSTVRFPANVERNSGKYNVIASPGSKCICGLKDKVNEVGSVCSLVNSIEGPPRAYPFLTKNEPIGCTFLILVGTTFPEVALVEIVMLLFSLTPFSGNEIPVEDGITTFVSCPA